MKIKLLILSLIAFTPLIGIYAQNTPEKMVLNFFEDFENKGTIIAIDNLYASTPKTNEDKKFIDNLKEELNKFGADLKDKHFKYEKLTFKQVSETYILYAYYLQFDDQYTKLSFEFCKPKEEWQVADCEFKASLDD